MSGSAQLRKFRRLISEGKTLMTACVESGLSIDEGRLTLKADAAEPPPPEAYEPLGNGKENDMARGVAKAKPIDGEIAKPDFKLALKLYRDEIRPAQSKVGEHAQEQSTAFKAIKKQAHIQPGAAKAAFKLMETEDAKRDDFIRSFVGLLKEAGKWPGLDLVDQAEGKTEVGGRPKPKLVEVPKGPADDHDLAGEGNEESAVQQAMDAAE